MIYDHLTILLLQHNFLLLLSYEEILLNLLFNSIIYKYIYTLLILFPVNSSTHKAQLHLSLNSPGFIAFSLPSGSRIIINLFPVSYLTLGIFVKSGLFNSVTTFSAN